MRKIFILAALTLTLVGCNKQVVYLNPALPPPLPESMKQSCPELPPVSDKAIGTLALADADSSYQYRKCKDGYLAVIESYESVRKSISEYLKTAEAERNKQK